MMESDSQSLPTRFEGKVALITGAASGIGRAVAVRLLAEGASVFGVDIDRTRLDELAELADSRLITREADVSDREACR
ncbi:MAG TPA: SDR family NAD(P)-dependent oxidoreductase, partial [Acidimicrobiales bacterium]|nr:SDR family NAD(P)-dependent oxidoreductase [Acidimicrobiales bacterium]